MRNANNFSIKAGVVFIWLCLPPVAGAGEAAGHHEISTQVTIKAGGFRLDRHSGHYVQSVTLKNVSNQPIRGPLYVGTGALPSGVSVVGAENAATTGPLLRVSRDDSVALNPGEQVTAVLRFDNRAKRPMQHQLKVFQKSAP